MGQLSDTVLVAQARLNRQGAFALLVTRYQERVRRFFLNHTMGNSELSDDLAQETFLRAYTHLPQFQALSSFSTWLYRIAYNVYYDHLRKNRVMVPLEGAQVENCCAVSPEVVGSKLDLYEAIGRLSERERTCITLYYMEDLSVRRIASVMGIPQGSVKSHLSRGRAHLATYLKNNGYEEL